MESPGQPLQVNDGLKVDAVDMSQEDLILQMGDLVCEMQRGEDRLRKFLAAGDGSPTSYNRRTPMGIPHLVGRAVPLRDLLQTLAKLVEAENTEVKNPSTSTSPIRGNNTGYPPRQPPPPPGPPPPEIRITPSSPQVVASQRRVTRQETPDLSSVFE